MNAPVPLRKPLDAFAISTMVVLCTIWGFQQVALKMGAPHMTPMLQVGIRCLFSALLVAGLMIWRRDNTSLRDGTLRPGVIVGLLFGAEFLAVSIGLKFTTAGHMAVFLYTAPIFTALGLHCLIKEERLARRQWTGVALAFLGIAVAFSGGLFAPGGSHMLLGDALGVLGGIFWAATTLGIRTTSLAETSSNKTLLYQLCGAAILLLPIAIARGDLRFVVPTSGLWVNLVFQTLVVAFASYLSWFWLLRKYLASRLSVFSFLTPLFGIAFGIVILHEPVDPRFALGAVLVLSGIAVVNRKV